MLPTPLHPTPMPVTGNSPCKSQAMERHEKYLLPLRKIPHIQLWCGSGPSLIRGSILSPDSPCLLPHSSNRKMGLVSTDPGDCSAGDVCRCLLAYVHSYPLPPPFSVQLATRIVPLVTSPVISRLSNYMCYSVCKQTKLSESLSL